MMDKMREWTNEEHLEFLNSIEASFVRAMFADGGVNTEEEHPSSQIDRLLRLDRYLPDSCDSTEDLPTQRHGSHNTSPPPPVTINSSEKN
ncbi:hypothetical protein Leryth_005094 [Lithospermum erythrorhizon]|nr:hypothetical protein Leryth_005094 [Lithospermum erythrorhizon]